MELIGSSTIWIENHPVLGWAPGRVDSLAANGSYLAVDDAGEHFEVPQDKARQVDPNCIKGVDDLLELGDFNEGSMLHNIRVRFEKDEIYTGIGGPILISLNPYATIAGLYSEAKQKYYRDRGAAISAGDAKIVPHLFSVGAAAYASMLKDSMNQSIIISGESGAGKTEATKRILTFFANLQSDQKARRDADPSGSGNIEEQVLRSNPILEAFGNAKTIRNDNSSRFGKFIEIEFDHIGKLQSARISNYLLEKCRIVTQQPAERGYHAFYQLCAGASSWAGGAELGLLHSSEHEYTKTQTDIPGIDDCEEFQQTVDCMVSLGFSSEERSSIYKIVASVLHLGDFTFNPSADVNEGCKVGDQKLATKVSSLLAVDSAALNKIFSFKTLEDPFTKKVIHMPQDAMGASNTRHSMAKVLYSRLFDWLVWRINQATLAKKASGKECRKIALLDIFGFEIFDWNSFEQLCINFANEKLQQHFNSHMFTLEQQLYTEEGISWSHIQFQDNREIIDSIEKKPVGVFAIVDSECLMPNSTDTSCLSKIFSSFKSSKIVYKASRFQSSTFAIAHYAGEVVYDIVSFLEKNTDKLHADIMNLLKSSGNTLVKTLFTDPQFAPELGGGPQVRTGAPAAKARIAPSAAGRTGAAGGDGGRAKNNVTVSMVFRQQLDQLVEDLNKTNPRYIRCIKPNAFKQPREFESIDVQRQLRCAGMLESIRIRRAGYSVRRPFKEFFNRFRVLAPQLSTAGRADPDYKELARKLLIDTEAKLAAEKDAMEAKAWQIGRSKVFLKEELQTKLEKRIGTAVAKFVVRIQKRWRGFAQRKRFKLIKRSGLAIQAALRTAAATKSYDCVREKYRGAIVIQAALRTLGLRMNYTRRGWAALMIQKFVRGWRSRKRIGKLKGKAAQERIEKMRQQEAQAKALEDARKESLEKEKALQEMQRQMTLERERAQAEAQRKLEGQRLMVPPLRQMSGIDAADFASPQNRQDVEKSRQEALELRKENARLQGLLESRGATATPRGSGNSVSEVELGQLRKDVQDLRREKVRLEVDLASRKTAEEFAQVASELAALREESSVLRRAKIDAELQFDQVSMQMNQLQSQVSRGEKSALELDILRQEHDDLQVENQRLKAKNGALEEQSQADISLRGELADLRLERLKLQGDLETSQMREEAISERLRAAQLSITELQSQKQRMVSMEVELAQARSQVDRLREQIMQAGNERTQARTDSLEQLRQELLGRIEANTSRQSIGPKDAVPLLGGSEGRGSMVGQRAIFEQLRKQFHESTAAGGVGQEDVDAALDQGLRVDAELEEELQQVRKENVDLRIRASGLQEEVKQLEAEATQHLRASAELKAEVQDLKLQLSTEAGQSRRLDQEATALRSRVVAADADIGALRSRLASAEEQALRAENAAEVAKASAARLQQEQETFERRMQEMHRQAAEAIQRARDTQPEVEEQRRIADHFRNAAEVAERSRLELEEFKNWLESENARLKREIANVEEERAKIRDVVDELVKAEGTSRSNELQKEIAKWKQRAEHFEREYKSSKELNQDMTEHMSQMLQAINDRQGESGDLGQQNRLLKKQLESQGQELKMVRSEKDDVQRQLDNLQSTGSYFQEKYREANAEARRLQQDFSVAQASATKLRERVESLQDENEQLKARCTKLAMDAQAGASESSRIEMYEQHVRELQKKIHAKEVEVQDNRDMLAKSQKVNGHLNTLLVLESEQSSLYEASSSITDEKVRSELAERKRKAQAVIGRLHDMLNDDERISITGLSMTHTGGSGGRGGGYRGGLDNTWAPGQR